MARKPKPPARTWVAYDDALAFTVAVKDAIENERYEDLPSLPTNFPPEAPGERVLLARSFSLSTYRALGDGSYQAGGVFVGGTGAVGMGLIAGSLIGTAIGRSAAKQRAAANAVPRWVVDEAGMLHVSTHALYFGSSHGLGRWHWDSLTGVNVIAPGQIQVQGNSRTGTVNWIIHSEAAELAFVMWALARHPQHPQLVSGTWLPPGWAAWAAYQRPHAGSQRPIRPLPPQLPR